MPVRKIKQRPLAVPHKQVPHHGKSRLLVPPVPKVAAALNDQPDETLHHGLKNEARSIHDKVAVQHRAVPADAHVFLSENRPLMLAGVQCWYSNGLGSNCSVTKKYLASSGSPTATS